MAEDTQTLIQNDTPTDNVVEIGGEHSRGMSCNTSKAIPVLSVFVALLIAGQAVSVYFISQQQSTISALSDATTALKLKDMMRNLPGSPQSQSRQKLRMATFSIPLAISDMDGSMQNLENIARKSNNIEDVAKFMLLRNNPLRNYPSFNGTILDNLRDLKKALSDQEWMMFDAWMQQWYLFFLVQSPKEAETTPAPTGAPALTECRMKATSPTLPGGFVPQCDEEGNYTPKQCWRSTGYCWCVYANGTEIAETRSRARIDCNDLQDMYEMDYEPFMEMNVPK